MQPDHLYTVIINTGGGLYRYQLHDVVQVTGFWGNCPLLRFVGKEAYISDWFGEKVNERQRAPGTGGALGALPPSAHFCHVSQR